MWSGSMGLGISDSLLVRVFHSFWFVMLVFLWFRFDEVS